MITIGSRKMDKVKELNPRKHGAKARELSQERLKTTLTFERGCQAYLWLTVRSSN